MLRWHSQLPKTYNQCTYLGSECLNHDFWNIHMLDFKNCYINRTCWWRVISCILTRMMSDGLKKIARTTPSQKQNKIFSKFSWLRLWISSNILINICVRSNLSMCMCNDFLLWLFVTWWCIYAWVNGIIIDSGNGSLARCVKLRMHQEYGNVFPGTAS